MASLVAGSRLLLHAPTGKIPLRALADVDLAADRWHLPVLAPVGALTAGAAVVEIPTTSGTLRIQAHLSLENGLLALRPGPGLQAPLLQQRREDVRGALRLPLRATTLDGGVRDPLSDVVLAGATTTISAGGLSAELGSVITTPSPGERVFVELDLPGGPLVPAVVSVVGGAGCLRGRFVDIAPIDRERLVRLVFAEQRRELAERRRRSEEAAVPHLP